MNTRFRRLPSLGTPESTKYAAVALLAGGCYLYDLPLRRIHPTHILSAIAMVYHRRKHEVSCVGEISCLST
jgi:hypothetical protein